MLDFRWSTINNELNKIKLLSDETERAARYQLIHNILEAVNEYKSHIYDYEHAQKKKEIADRGVVFVPYTKPETLTSNWRKLFASSISVEDKKDIGFDAYNWHIFSFEKIYALSQS